MNGDQRSRQLEVKLLIRNEKDDPSILGIVRGALEDGLHTSATSITIFAPMEPTEQPEHHPPLSEDLESDARKVIEKALAKVVERFQAAGHPPKFDPAKWVEQLSKVWGVVRKAKAAGVQIRVLPDESPPPVEGE